MSLKNLVAQLDKLEREDEDPETAMFAANFGKLLRTCLKD